MYTFLKIAHVLGATAYLGALLFNRKLKGAAEQTRDERIMAFAYQTMRRNDLTLGMPGMAALLLVGVGMILHQPSLMRMPGGFWLHLSLGLTLVNLGTWMAMMVPAQKRLAQLSSPSDPAREGLSRRWDLGWGLTMASALAILALMIGRFARP